MRRHAVLIIVGAVLVNNFVLNRFLGCCPFLGVSEILRGLSPEILKEIAFFLAPEARIWHNSCAESFSRADVVLRDPSGRAAWLAVGAEEGFCNYLKHNPTELK